MIKLNKQLYIKILLYFIQTFILNFCIFGSEHKLILQLMNTRNLFFRKPIEHTSLIVVSLYVSLIILTTVSIPIAIPGYYKVVIC